MDPSHTYAEIWSHLWARWGPPVSPTEISSCICIFWGFGDTHYEFGIKIGLRPTCSEIWVHFWSRQGPYVSLIGISFSIPIPKVFWDDSHNFEIKIDLRSTCTHGYLGLFVDQAGTPGSLTETGKYLSFSRCMLRFLDMAFIILGSKSILGPSVWGFRRIHKLRHDN